MPEKMIPIHCPLCCDQPFEDQQSLFFHLRALRNNLFCTICSDRFDTLENLISHLSRKCNGPKSLDAKRKCLLSINLNQRGYQPAECSSSDNINELESAGQVSSIIQSVTSVSESSETERGLESTNIVHSSTSTKLNSIQPELIIPQELKNKLSKSVTLSIGPLSKSPNAKKVLSKSKTSTNVQEISSSSKIGSMSHLLPKNAWSKVLTDRTADDSVKTQTKANNKTKENLLTTPLTKTSVQQNQLEQSQFHPNVSKKAHLQAGFLTSVQAVKPNKMTISSDDFQKKTKTLPDPTTLSPAISYLNPVGVSPISMTASTPRKRGRPRKYAPNGQLLSTLNGPVQKPEPQYVLPDILDEAELYGINEDNNVNNTMRNQGVSAKNINCPRSESSKSYPKEHMQKKDEICQLNFKEEIGLEKVKMNQEGEGSIEENEIKSEDEEEYTCSACNVRFTSICEHIRQFHNGEEVVVEVPEEEINEELKAYQGDKIKTPVKDVHSSSLGSNNEEGFLGTIQDTETEIKHSDSLKCKDKSYSESKELQSVSHRSSSTKTTKSITALPPFGKWKRTSSGKKEYYQFVNNPAKLKTLILELTGNDVYIKKYDASFKDLFENPKINLIELTNKPSAPFFTYKQVDFEKPIPMYVVEKQINKCSQSMLGDSASYILANSKCTTPIPESSTLISVMNVILASDKELSVENIVFNKKPCDDMIPVLEDVTNPPIPLLRKAKMLKWMCTKCLTVTWKFPLSPDTHMCNTCLICHKPFVSSISLKKHTAIHKKDGSQFCSECNKAFANRGIFQTHLELHSSHALCASCKLFVPKNEEFEHRELHNKNPCQQFLCSVCQKVFGSNSEVKSHEIAQCSRLVARFNCSTCDKKFFSLTALSFHMRKHKSIVIQYPCRFCNKMFVREKEQCLTKTGKRKPSSYIQKIWHERIHTRERPYSCSACPKRFRSLPYQQSHAAHAHRGSEHQDLPAYMCRLCDKTFPSSQKLSSHMLTHNVSEPHQDIAQLT